MKPKLKTLKAKINSAFSLVELLVVIAVIAVIAAIAIPNIVGTREAAVAARDAANIEEAQRFLANIRGAGNSDAEIADIVDGFTWTSPEGITFTYTQSGN
jgi:type IV pilus assembly protein PilA